MKVAFICFGNTCRSQLALGIAQKYYEPIGSFYSAGISPGSYVAPNAVRALAELDISLSILKARGIESLPKDIDLYIVMGRDVGFQSSNSKVIYLNISDPIGKDYPFYCATRDEIVSCLEYIFKEENEEVSHE